MTFPQTLNLNGECSNNALLVGEIESYLAQVGEVPTGAVPTSGTDSSEHLAGNPLADMVRR